MGSYNPCTQENCMKKTNTDVSPYMKTIVLSLSLVAIAMSWPGIIKAETLPDCSAVTYETDDQSRYLIGNLEQLQCMKEILDGEYLLTNNIDAGDTENWDGGKGFLPIGEDSFERFEGNFNGNGYEISNLTINRPDERKIGLFGYTRDAVIANVGLIDVNISGQSEVGALIGEASQSEVTACHATGQVTGQFSHVGGLIGINNGTVRISYTNVHVKGGDEVGGLIGREGFSEQVMSSYAIGPVEGQNRVGGLIGQTQGDVVNSYATGHVSGNDDIGGLVGRVGNNGHITNSYAAGEVTGTQNLGGLIGILSPDQTSVTRSFWNTDVQGVENGLGNGATDGITGLTDSEMRQENSFTNWNFIEIWNINEGLTYPWLRSNTQVPAPGLGDPPATPVLTNPADNAEDVNYNVTLRWDNDEAADYYHVHVSTSEDFETTFFYDEEIESNSIVLTNLNPFTTYYWQVRGENLAGLSDWSPVWSFTTRQATSASDDPAIPSSYQLMDNYPNPFNPATTISYELPEKAAVTLRVYSLLGEHIATLVNATQDAGRYQVNFPADNLSSGLYIYRLQAGDFMKSKKMMLVK